ncbi:MAG: hypothetical protein LBL66_00575 [Clostridiales bacterium]|jgi:hypothetical protein|nr:hypothetical protein [Clostridiales bacterium]
MDGPAQRAYKSLSQSEKYALGKEYDKGHPRSKRLIVGMACCGLVIIAGLVYKTVIFLRELDQPYRLIGYLADILGSAITIWLCVSMLVRRTAGFYKWLQETKNIVREKKVKKGVKE